MATDISDRLQPALLDRLIGGDENGGRAMSRAELRAAVLRDLGTLLNAIQPGASMLLGDERLEASVLNFGLPPLAGKPLRHDQVAELEAQITLAIRRFEPRIDPATLQVRAVRSPRARATHNVIEFEIRGDLWSRPLPQELLLRTRLNLEAGQVAITDTRR